MTVCNDNGQRPGEMALNIDTALVFQQNGGENVTADGYAGRTLFRGGNVLLHNARKDVVKRVLRRVAEPNDAATVTELSSVSPFNPQEGSPPASARHEPFVRLRKENSCIEPVSPDSFELMKLVGDHLARCSK
jgi:hypothetical protein